MTPEEIAQIDLPRSLRGYDRAETDRVLRELLAANGALRRERDELATGLARRTSELGELRQELRDQDAALAELCESITPGLGGGSSEPASDEDVVDRLLGKLRELDRRLRQTWIIAERASARVREEARHEAEDVLRRARKRAVELVENARVEHGRLDREVSRLRAERDRETEDVLRAARATAAAIVRVAEQRRDGLEEELERLGILEQRMRTTLRDLANATLERLESESAHAPEEEVATLHAPRFGDGPAEVEYATERANGGLGPGAY